jgi:type I restriction-modification system DNA methylase subunit
MAGKPTIAFKPKDSVASDFRTEFQTPLNVVKYMCNLIPDGVESVLEPTPGIGRIANELRKRNYDVTAPNDFFLLKPRRFDCVVMNPPFSSKWGFLENAPEGFNHTGMRLGYYILNECLAMSDCVIALMPWFTISDSDLRLRSVKNYGLKSVTALPRNTFQYARIQTCVLELRKAWDQPTLFHVLGHPNNQLILPTTTTNTF